MAMKEVVLVEFLCIFSGKTDHMKNKNQQSNILQAP